VGNISASGEDPLAIQNPGSKIQNGEVLDRLASLVDNSLLQRVADEQGEPDSRYRMLETIREYGLERLAASGELADAQRGHARFFLALAEEAEGELLRSARRWWRKRMERERHNLRAALATLIRNGEGHASLRLSGALWRCWELQGCLVEGPDRLAEILTLAGALERTPTRAEALHTGAELAERQGDLATARALYAESLAIRRELDDRRGIADLLNALGMIAYEQGESTAAHALYRECLTFQRELGDDVSIATTLNRLGLLAQDQGDLASAQELYRESLEIWRALDNEEEATDTAQSLLDVAEEALQAGDYRMAGTLFAESLAVLQELDRPRDVASCLGGLAIVASALGEPERSAHLFGAADALREAIGAPLAPADYATYERSIGAARAALGEAGFATAWEQGRRMSLEQRQLAEYGGSLTYSLASLIPAAVDGGR
jgi:non-specific serine/threonine protein kinase